MANTIKLKRASGSDPSASDLSVGELAIRTSNCKLFSKNDGGSAIGIVAGSADTLTTARTIAGVSFDVSANISLNNNAITNGAGYLADIVSDTSPQLGGDLDVQSSKITTATSNGNVKIEPNGTGVVEVRGAGGNDGKLQLNCSAQSHGIKLASPAHSAGQSYTLIFPDNQIAADKYLKIKSISGSGSTAIGQAENASLDANDLGEGTVPDARFPSTLPALNGSALTDLNGSNIASGTISASRIPTLNQNTTGSAATLTTARTIAGVSFDGSANISLNNNAITNGAGYITDLVNVTSPQLGGDLASNGNNINMADNDIAKFGTGGDLEILHDGSHSRIRDVGTGILSLQSNDLRIHNVAATEYMARFVEDAQVELYYDNNKKFETLSDGVNITGTLKVNNSAVIASPVQAWVTFNCVSTIFIVDDYNVSSITDNATGVFTVNFSSNLASDDYMVTSNGTSYDSDHTAVSMNVDARSSSGDTLQLKTTSACKFICNGGSTTEYDPAEAYAGFFL